MIDEIEVNYDLRDENNQWVRSDKFSLTVRPMVGDRIRDRRHGDYVYEVVSVNHILERNGTRIAIGVKLLTVITKEV